MIYWPSALLVKQSLQLSTGRALCGSCSNLKGSIHCDHSLSLLGCVNYNSWCQVQSISQLSLELTAGTMGHEPALARALAAEPHCRPADPTTCQLGQLVPPQHWPDRTAIGLPHNGQCKYLCCLQV